MTLMEAVQAVLQSQIRSGKPLAVILAGHNGSGKSTLWYGRLADIIRIPLINADRMMMSILPEDFSRTDTKKPLPPWAADIRDSDSSWMKVAQKGVEAFVAQAMAHKVPFAMETVFSYWDDSGGGPPKSKVDLIRELQRKGYYVLLLFVGLSNAQLSVARVSTRVARGGHDVALDKLACRFPRTQKAVGVALTVANAAILTDNSRTQKEAFTVCRIQIGNKKLFDCRDGKRAVPAAILDWLSVVCGV